MIEKTGSAVLLFASLVGVAPTAVATPHAILITHANLFDGRNEKLAGDALSQ